MILVGFAIGGVGRKMATVMAASVMMIVKRQEKTRALIIDVRRHTGGSADPEAYFASYFVKGKQSVAVDKFVWRNEGTETYKVEEFHSSPTPFNYKGRRLYVLTSGHTFSAGEALAYDMRSRGRGRR